MMGHPMDSSQFFLEIVFLILGSMLVAAFSRWREFRADRGGATLAGRENMIAALEKLRQTYEIADPRTKPAIQALQISGKPRGLMAMFRFASAAGCAHCASAEHVGVNLKSAAD